MCVGGGRGKRGRKVLDCHEKALCSLGLADKFSHGCFCRFFGELSCWVLANMIPLSKVVPHLRLALPNPSLDSDLTGIALSGSPYLHWLLLHSPMFKWLQANVLTEFSPRLWFIHLWPPTKAHAETFQMESFFLKGWFNLLWCKSDISPLCHGV